MEREFSTSFGREPITIRTGKLAMQAGGAVLVRWGDSVVLVTATASQQPRHGVDFFPLTVDLEVLLGIPARTGRRSAIEEAGEAEIDGRKIIGRHDGGCGQRQSDGQGFQSRKAHRKPLVILVFGTSEPAEGNTSLGV